MRHTDCARTLAYQQLESGGSRQMRRPPDGGGAWMVKSAFRYPEVAESWARLGKNFRAYRPALGTCQPSRNIKVDETVESLNYRFAVVRMPAVGRRPRNMAMHSASRRSGSRRRGATGCVHQQQASHGVTVGLCGREADRAGNVGPPYTPPSGVCYGRGDRPTSRTTMDYGA